MTTLLDRSSETAFVAPTNVQDTLTVLRDHGHSARPIAGGTDLMLQLGRGETRASVLVYVGRLAELTSVETTSDGVRIGAGATHRTLGLDTALQASSPALVRAAGLIGGRQTQAVGTIGGNLVNASPAADLIPPLAAADAVVHIASLDGERSMNVLDFVRGRRDTALGPDELVTAVTIPERLDGTGDAFFKVGRRGAMEISIASVAARLTVTDGRITSARIVVGACAPSAFRASEAEEELVGAVSDELELDEIGRLVAARATPIDDVRATARYRLQVLPRVTRHVLERALASATAKGADS